MNNNAQPMMSEVFIWTGLRHILDYNMYNDDIYLYLVSIWHNLSQNTIDGILNDCSPRRSMYKDSPNLQQHWQYLTNLEFIPSESKEYVTLNEDFVLYAVIYAVGRMTYVVSWITEELHKIWGNLSINVRKRIHVHIQNKSHVWLGLGADMDETRWRKILELPIDV